MWLAVRGPRAASGLLRAVVPIVLLATLAACEDQIKYFGWFSTMTKGAAVQTYEQQPRDPVPGTMPVDGWIEYSIIEADTALTNPLESTPENIERGHRLFQQFCVACHGEGARGDGPVVGPGRLPATPLMDLTGENARTLSDGYIWGMIGNGRGLMPSYRRVLPEQRWYIITFIRDLQRATAPSP